MYLLRLPIVYGKRKDPVVSGRGKTGSLCVFCVSVVSKGCLDSTVRTVGGGDNS